MVWYGMIWTLALMGVAGCLHGGHRLSIVGVGFFSFGALFLVTAFFTLVSCMGGWIALGVLDFAFYSRHERLHGYRLGATSVRYTGLAWEGTSN